LAIRSNAIKIKFKRIIKIVRTSLLSNKLIGYKEKANQVTSRIEEKAIAFK